MPKKDRMKPNTYGLNLLLRFTTINWVGIKRLMNFFLGS